MHTVANWTRGELQFTIPADQMTQMTRSPDFRLARQGGGADVISEEFATQFQHKMARNGQNCSICRSLMAYCSAAARGE